MSRDAIAFACRVRARTVIRWEKGRNKPSLSDRRLLLRLLVDAPPADLAELARLSGTTLAHAGIEPPPEQSALPVAVAPPPAPPPVTPVPSAESIQRAVDDAIREAAEELNVRARDLRLAANKLLQALGRAGVTIEGAARMVLPRPEPPLP